MLPNGKLVVVVILCAATVKVDLATIIRAPKAVNADWFKNAVIYQIYTRSFKDSAGNDGVGDIPGIIEKLNYLSDSGVTAIWLPPIHSSADPLTVDFGYETTDYTGIHGEYGTIENFQELVTKAHELGIKIIMEIVPNHSSKKHQWFIDSEKRVAAFENHYVWRSGDAETIPNNWISHFNQPAWTYSTIREEWYLHQFGAEQPDLNYRNQAVRDEITSILNTWLDLGVDGFLMGDVPYLAEDETFTDETPSGTGAVGDYESLNHIYTSNQEETYNIISEWREVIDTYNNLRPEEDPRIIITKADTDLEKAMRYCGNGDIKGAHFTYNFLLATGLNTDLKAQTIVDTIERWTTTMPEQCVANWVLGNHDLHRAATRFTPELVDSLNILLAFLPGVMITYNGEEIGQENGLVTVEACRDPMACSDPENYNTISRDFERTPFHWDDSTNAGFSAAATTWLPVSEKYITNNVKLQSRPGYTTNYQTYKALTKLRQESGFNTAVVTHKVLSENVLALYKQDANEQFYLALINTADASATLDLSQIAELKTYLKVLVANSASTKHNRVLSKNDVVLGPYESIIVKALPVMEEGDATWWEHAVVYQIYPLSFKDNNNDGFGDLQGIISKLQYLKDTGVTAAWLSPIYESPQVDAGYDISNYRAIDPRFGSFDDFNTMVEQAHALGIKIVMDFVPNHSSDQHEWFEKSVNRESGFEDFYIWHDGQNNGQDPPNNWISLFKGAAWTKHETRGQWYLHQFAKEQPDLNYRSPAVVNEMKDVLKFWMDLGVDGFRMDAVPYLLEDENFTDEPPSGVGETGQDHESLLHIYTSDLPGTFNVIYEWREFVDDYTKEQGGDARILMTEAYTDIDNTMKYYGDGERDGGHFTFNFQLITLLNSDSNAKVIEAAVNEWLTNIPENRISNWVLGNHDNHRVASRFHPKNVDGLNMLIGVLPGVMVTYNGEEIGQENGEVTWEQCKDPRACKENEEDYDANSRDFERTPFHWDDTVNAGFNTGSEPWLPVSSKYTELNLAAQNVPDEQSHYNLYKDLLSLRSESVLIEGTNAVVAISDNVLTVTRTVEGGDSYLLLFNVGDETETIQIKTVLDTITPYVKIALRSSESEHVVGELILSGELSLGGHESIIIATTGDIPITEGPTTTSGGAAETISFITLISALIYLVFTH